MSNHQEKKTFYLPFIFRIPSTLYTFLDQYFHQTILPYVQYYLPTHTGIGISFILYER